MPVYNAEPTLQRFHACEAIIKGVRGPFGSGKSVGMVMETIRLGSLQHRRPDGKRYSRMVAIRNTYGELTTTTIKTYLDWWDDYAVLRRSPPYEGVLKMPLADGSVIEQELIFLSMDRPKDIKKLKSLETTIIWANEASELGKPTIDTAISRLWRYPKKSDGGPAMSSLIMDTNSPDTDHWWYEMAENGDEELRAAILKALRKHAGDVIPANMELMRFFRQPPALLEMVNRDGTIAYKPNPAAENVKNQSLGFGYWLQMLPEKTHEWIKVYILGEYGAVVEGKPVYPEYSDHLHCAKDPFQPIPGLPILVGADAGLTPAVVLAQHTPAGQLRVFDEICGKNVGIRTFMSQVVRPYIQATYRSFPIKDFDARCDPSSVSRSDIDETMTWVKEASQILGVDFRPAPTNEFGARREAVAGFLTRTIAGGQPAFQLSPKCKTLRNGFTGKYHLARIEVTGQERYRDEPVKDMYSHPHDGLQYLALPLDWTLMSHIDRLQRRNLNAQRRHRIIVGSGGDRSGY